ncbi:hypothetical protein [Sorangium sp. So ce1389]|uniref:hypothetical protein n=1 Tax=Sorangium sp. So ce1389 TaxID=3133336 RepID=UPI003F60D9FD
MWMRTSLRSLAGLGIMAVSGCGLVLGLDDFEDAAPAEGTTAAGTGGGPTCEPESEVECYSGPPGTRDVGICRAGTQACKQDGSGYEACSGEVTPAAETCASTEDEDCDGKDCVEWARLIGGAEEEAVSDVAVDAMGNVYVAGYFKGAVPFGDEALIASGEADAFLVKLSAAGDYIWSRQLGDIRHETSYSLAVSSDGEAFVVILELEDDFSSMSLSLRKYDPEGALLWERPLGGALCGGLIPSVVADMSFHPDGDLVLAGSYCGSIRLDDTHAISNDSEREDSFVAKIRSSDGFVDDQGAGWVRSVGGDDAQFVRDIVVDSAGNIIVLGYFYEELNLGDRSYPSAGGSDVFLAKLTSRGLVSWVKTLGNAENDTIQTAAVDSLGGPIVAMSFEGVADFGGGDVAVSKRATVLLKYTTSNAYEWGEVLGSTLGIQGLSFGSGGDMVVVGSLSGSVELGGKLLRAESKRDLVLMKMNSERDPLWVRVFGEAGQGGTTAESHVLRDSGGLLIAGHVNGKVDLGAGVMTPRGDGDVFVASLSP